MTESKIDGASVSDYSSPLFLAWQLTNRCEANCLTCCEESGPGKAWSDEMSEAAALKFAREVVEAGIPYAAFGGGEPLAVPFFWKIAEIFHQGGVGLKLETNGLPITEEKADYLKSIHTNCIQISMDGATRETFDKVRPGGRYDDVVAVLKRLGRCDLQPEWVFVPNRINVHEIARAYEMAADLGCRTFVTGPMMRLGRAAEAWATLGLEKDEWARAADRLRERAAAMGEPVKLSIYPWDILTEMTTRLKSPQAMVLVVPNGRAKLLNALPFAPASVIEHSISECWTRYQDAWKSDEVRDFIETCQTKKELLLHANETWWPGEWDKRRAASGV